MRGCPPPRGPRLQVGATTQHGGNWHAPGTAEAEQALLTSSLALLPDYASFDVVPTFVDDVDLTALLWYDDSGPPSLSD